MENEPTTDVVWSDDVFLAEHGVIDEYNLINYFMHHNDFDHTTIQKAFGELGVEDSGKIYKVERLDLVTLVIKKLQVDKGKVDALNSVHYCTGHLIFRAPYVKDLLRMKIQNMCSLVNKMTELVKDSS